jgi:hypothetical protein
MRRDFHLGAVTEVVITLVSSDANDLACSLPRRPWGFACREGVEPAPARAESTLTPCVTVERRDLLVPGLFADPTIAARVAADEAASLPREARQRFLARCRVRVLERVSDVRTRFLAGEALSPPRPAWLVWPLACTVHPDRG